MLELEGEALQARKEELLDLCRWMRDWLRNEGGLKMISEDFPIEEFSEAVTMTLTRAQARAREVEEEVVGQEEGEEEDRPHVVTHMTAIKGEDVLARGVEPVLTCEPSTFLGYCRVAHDDWECSTLVDALQGVSLSLSVCFPLSMAGRPTTRKREKRKKRQQLNFPLLSLGWDGGVRVRPRRT